MIKPDTDDLKNIMNDTMNLKDLKGLKIVRSRRKTIALEITASGEIILRAPQFAAASDIERFVKKHSGWIRKHMEKIQKESENPLSKLSDDELRLLYKKAKEEITGRVSHYAPLVGVTYGKITVRCQKTRWGSCSSNGNLSFNCLLMLAPREVLDSIVVHELCHRKEMNHSKRFYSEVFRVFPDYKKCNLWLKENGKVLMKNVF